MRVVKHGHIFVDVGLYCWGYYFIIAANIASKCFLHSMGCLQEHAVQRNLGFIFVPAHMKHGGAVVVDADIEFGANEVLELEYVVGLHFFSQLSFHSNLAPKYNEGHIIARKRIRIQAHK